MVTYKRRVRYASLHLILSVSLYSVVFFTCFAMCSVLYTVMYCFAVHMILFNEFCFKNSTLFLEDLFEWFYFKKLDLHVIGWIMFFMLALKSCEYFIDDATETTTNLKSRFISHYKG